VRIVGGRHRGRRLEAPAGLAVRPTADRTREALFNILEHGRLAADGGVSPLLGARVLDGFCGSGALGLEALSRGAAHATFMDTSAVALAATRANAARLDEAARTTVLRADPTRPSPAVAPATIVLLDPPYGSGLAAPALSALAAARWIGDGATCAVEMGATEKFAPPAGFALLDERRYGKARLVFLRAL